MICGIEYESSGWANEEELDRAEWTALATAAGVHPPSPEICNLTVTIL